MVVLSAVDVVVLLKLVHRPEDVTEQALAEELGIGQSQVHRAIRQGAESRIVTIAGRRGPGRGATIKRLNKRALQELVVFGVPYVFPAAIAGPTRGVPTAGSAPVLAKHFAEDPEPVVWPDPAGGVRGSAVEPLHPCVPTASRRDSELYDMLALVDALRVGRARERSIARSELEARLL